jgi:hypothetical protein
MDNYFHRYATILLVVVAEKPVGVPPIIKYVLDCEYGKQNLRTSGFICHLLSRYFNKYCIEP